MVGNTLAFGAQFAPMNGVQHPLTKFAQVADEVHVANVDRAVGVVALQRLVH